MRSATRRLWVNTIFCLTILSCFVFAARFGLQQSLMPPLRAEPTSTINAPEFPTGQWLNTDKPLTIRGLRGKIVLLDFWTYGCINCMHILPDLKKLERKYPNELVIVGVHSAKFNNEKDASNIRNAMMRYNIEHPIFVDSDMRVWNDYTVNAWPTLVLIDPAGKVFGSVSGEGNYDVLDKSIGDLIQRFKAGGQLNTQPIAFALDAAKREATDLRYPGKVLADAKSGHLFIADSNHNRILVTNMSGEVQATIGTGALGHQDGPFAEATFANPQGMALGQSSTGTPVLYVADTDNHLIRAIDLNGGTVSTIAGTGKQASWRSSGGVGTQAEISSPWDLQLIGNTLYIAMAGPHQIWSMDLASKQIGPFAGSGREARIDGVRLGGMQNGAAFAQPSGLTTDGKALYVADSEISAIRSVDLPDSGEKVRTLAGGDLFDFGDRDGSGDQVRLQHPLGVAWHEGKVYIADTYNSKIKVLDPATGQVQTFLGGRGNKDGAAPQFYEPGGLSIAGDKLFVADTNNHVVKVVDLKTKNTTTLALKGVPAPAPSDPVSASKTSIANAAGANSEAGTQTVGVATLAPNAQGELVLDIKLPAGHHLNEGAPQRFQARVEGKGVQLGKALVTDAEFKLPLRLKLKTGAAGSSGTVVASVAVYYCTDNNGLCKYKSLRLRAPFKVSETGANEVVMKAEL